MLPGHVLTMKGQGVEPSMPPSDEPQPHPSGTTDVTPPGTRTTAGCVAPEQPDA